MSKKLTVSTESFDYPVTGSDNYGEGATGWAEAINNAVAEFFGPGDIRTTETVLLEGQTADVTGLTFDASFVQRILVQGFITRTFNSATTRTESFVIEGTIPNTGADIQFSATYTGDDTGIEFSSNGGQIRYTSEVIPDTNQITIKFKANAIIDESSI